jgi:hypothetical protein
VLLCFDAAVVPKAEQVFNAGGSVCQAAPAARPRAATQVTRHGVSVEASDALPKVAAVDFQDGRLRALEQEVRTLRAFVDDLLRALRESDSLDELKQAVPDRLPEPQRL